MLHIPIPRSSPVLLLAAACTVATAVATFARPARAAPMFDDAINALGTQACGGAGCWTNYLRVSDLDGDGDLDIVFVNYAGFFTMGSAQPLVIYLNDGDGAFSNGSEEVVDGYWGRLRQVAIGDVDGDGLPDIVAPSGWAESNALFMNNGDGTFTNDAADRLPAAVVYAGGARLGDIDDDGDLDILIADGYGQGMGHATVAALWRNDGSGHFDDASEGLPTDKQGYDPDDIDLIDVDRDFDLDILINMHASNSSLWINDGQGGFTDAPEALPDQPQGPPNQGGAYHYNPGVCDVDGDGDLDIWIDNCGPDYGEQLLINNGDGTFSDETAARVSGNPSSDDNGIVCADVDDDGDLDAVVVALNYGNSTPERVLKNDGAGVFTYEDGLFPDIHDPSLWAEFGDLNGDGRIDLVTGQGEGNPELNRVYMGNDAQPEDTRPPVLLAVESVEDAIADEDVIVHFAVSDRSVTDEGPRLLAAFIEYAPNPQVEETVPGWFMGGDLFRATIPGAGPGATVVYRACATDLAGNMACSEDQEYTIADDGTTGDPTGTGTTDPTTTGATTGDSDSSGSDTGNSPTTGDPSDGSASASASAGDSDSDSGTDSTDSGPGSGEDVEGCGCTHGRHQAPAGALLGLWALGCVRRRRR